MDGVEELGRPAYAGIDTHKDANVLALLDRLGRVLGTWEFATGSDGQAALEGRIGDPSVPVGIEGVGSYGAGIASHLAGRGYRVFEMVRPRREQRRRGKTDQIDAVAAARNLAAGRGLPPKALDGAAGDVRWLMTAREQLVRHMTALSNCIDSMLVTAPQGVRDAYAGLGRPERMRRLSRSRPRDACRRTLRLLARRWLEAEREAAGLESEMEGLLRESHPALMGAPCVATITAARIVSAAGSNPGRMGSEAAFSMLCGTSPIPASSGRTDRHRLNRGGDRQANRAIHEIARARMATDGRTRRYIAKKLAEGKTKKEAVRCLCRFIAREVYRLLTGPQEPLPDGEELAERRRALGVTQAQLADAIGATRGKVSRAERRKEYHSTVLNAMDGYLEALERTRPKHHVDKP